MGILESTPGRSRGEPVAPPGGPPGALRPPRGGPGRVDTCGGEAFSTMAHRPGVQLYIYIEREREIDR